MSLKAPHLASIANNSKGMWHFQTLHATKSRLIVTHKACQGGHCQATGGLQEIVVFMKKYYKSSQEVFRYNRFANSNVAAFSVHPGIIFSNLWRHSYFGYLALVFGYAFTKSSQQGAATQVYAAVEPSLKGHAGDSVSQDLERSPLTWLSC